MSEKDLFHNAVRHALEKDGWTITHDPLSLRFQGRDVFVDLGAEQRLAAEKAERKIAVEIKSFLSPSPVRDLELAVGQIALYRTVLAVAEPDRRLYRAVRTDTFRGIISEPLGQLVVSANQVPVLVFDTRQEVIVRWIEPENMPRLFGV